MNEWHKLPYCGFHSTLWSTDFKMEIVCLFVGIANHLFLGNLGNLNHSKYFESKIQAKFTIAIVVSIYMEE